MDVNIELTWNVENKAKEAGADLVGFADPAHYEHYPMWQQPDHFLENVQTVIVIGIHLFDIILDAWSKDQTQRQSYQFADEILKSICHQVKTFLVENGYSAEVVPYGGLLLKDSAALAGIGPIGKNNLLITPEFGPQVRLRAIVTDAVLAHGTPIRTSSYCQDCHSCIDACPAGALAEGQYDVNACKPYQLDHLRELSSQTKIWCNVCIEACPVGKRQDLFS